MCMNPYLLRRGLNMQLLVGRQWLVVTGWAFRIR